jgi:hypothetical protein
MVEYGNIGMMGHPAHRQVRNNAARRPRSTGVPPVIPAGRVRSDAVRRFRGMGILPMISDYGKDARATSEADKWF